MVSFKFMNDPMDPSSIVFIVLLVVMIVALLVVPMFTNKKRAKQAEEQYRSLRPGALIKTVGGVIGTVKEIRQVSPQDREMIIETGEGENKTTMTFDIMALYQILSPAPADESENAVDKVESNGDVFASDNAENVDVENKAGKIAEEKPVEEPTKEQADELAANDSTFASQLLTEENSVTEETAAADAQPVTETVVEDQADAEDNKPAAEKKPAAKKSTSSGSKSATAKKPAAKKPIAKNK